MGPKFLIYQLHPAKPICLGRLIKFTAVPKNIIVFSKYIMCSQKSSKYLCFCCNVVFYVENQSMNEECRHFTDMMAKFIASVTMDARLYYKIRNFCSQTSMDTTWVCFSVSLTVYKLNTNLTFCSQVFPVGCLAFLYIFSEFLQWWLNLQYYSWVKLLFLLLQNRHI